MLRSIDKQSRECVESVLKDWQMLKMALFCVIFTTIFKIDREICTLVMDELVLLKTARIFLDFYVSEMWILALYIMLDGTRVAHSKEKNRHSWNKSTLVKALCHLHQQLNLWVVTRRVYMLGQKIAVDGYYCASMWTENGIYVDWWLKI